MSSESIIHDFTEDKFVEWATGLVTNIVEVIRMEGIGAYITGIVARNLITGKKRAFNRADITIIGNDKNVILTVRRALAMHGFKRVGEIYNSQGDLYTDEWVFESDTFQLFININYNHMAYGSKIPPNPTPIFIRDNIMDLLALIYEAYVELVRGVENTDDLVDDIKQMIKLYSVIG